jgi:MFS family permease
MARDLRLFYLFRLLATSYLWTPIFVTFMLGRGISFYQLMWLEALFSGVAILVEIPTGALADRIGRRESMMAGALAMVASCVLSYHATGFGEFAVATALGSLSMSLCSGADSAYLYDLLHSHGRGHEYTRLEGVASAWHLTGQALACAIGGALGSFDLSVTYIATAAVSGVAFVVAVFLRERVAPAPPAGRPVRQELASYAHIMRRAIADLRGNRRLLWIMGYSAVVFTLLKITIVLYQPYLDTRGFGLTARGLTLAGIHLLAAMVALRAHQLRRRMGEGPLIWGLLGMLAASFLLLTVLPGPWALSMLAVQAAATGLYAPLVKPIINRETPDSGRRATVLSIENIMRRAAMLVFLPVAGVAGASSAITLCAALGFGGGLLLALGARQAPGRAESRAAAAWSASPASPETVD